MPLEPRFLEALSGTTSRLENCQLWAGPRAVVVPTLGMIVPKWFLVIPRAHTFNCAQQGLDTQIELSNHAATIFHQLRSQGEELLVFEHGAHRAATKIGCGLDHAHLHVIVAPTIFVRSIISKLSAEISPRVESRHLNNLYAGVNSNQPYYMAWLNGKRFIDQPAKSEVSQLFRKIVAEKAGITDQWDYKVHPFHQHIAQTVALVRRQGAAAA